eukprot:TRINITY_DN3941_c0_g1_i1.p1 TRINITY_DN3941_c0_g1~~TRINITY_DN3941_c0_g1_i1.p1  ORF type:complete len:188 (-),score=29.29 TRINITY_DN3941_c0_g1_i1:17-580(-)
MRVQAVIVLALISMCFGAQLTYPLYKQCDTKWGQQEMGVPGQAEDDTICHQGCAMSCVSMALAGFNITIDGQVSTPETLNNWLRKNNGYVCLGGDCCNLVLDAPNRIAPLQVKSLGEPLTPFLPTLQKMVQDGLIVIAHVRNRSHFVLLTGVVLPSSFLVNDPGFDQKIYHYSDIHDILLYDFINTK